jgi:hypothetical protein
MDRQYNDKWGAVNRRDGQTIQLQLSSSILERWTDNTITYEEQKTERWTDNMTNDKWGAYCSSFVIILSVHLSDLLLLIRHCIVCPSLRFTAPHLSLYCLTIPLIYCSSIVIVLSVHLFDLLLLICHCIVCPSLRFTAPHLSLYCLSISPIYCSSFVIVLSIHLSDLLLLICHYIVCPSLWFIYNDKWGAVNRRDGQTIQWQMRSNKSERWTDNTMTNEEQ